MVRHLLAPCVLSLGCLIVFADHKAVSKVFPIRDAESITVVDPNLSTQSQVLLPREREIELALKACPLHLRNDATVYTFGKNGYEKARPGPNGFNCMVNREGIQNAHT